MTKYRSGENMFVRWVTLAGTFDQTADYTKFSVDRSISLLESTAGNVADEAYVAGIKGGSATMEYFDQTEAAGTSVEAAMAEGTFGTLYWARQGTATGKPKRAMAAFVNSIKEKGDYDSLHSWEVEFKKSGALVHAAGAVW